MRADWFLVFLNTIVFGAYPARSADSEAQNFKRDGTSCRPALYMSDQGPSNDTNRCGIPRSLAVLYIICGNFEFSSQGGRRQKLEASSGDCNCDRPAPLSPLLSAPLSPISRVI